MFVMALGALAFGACGDDDDGGVDVSEEERPYVDALVASMRSGDEGDMVLTQEQAECVAPQWIDTIGVDALQDAGIEPEDIGDDSGTDLDELGLSEDQANALFDAFDDCDVDIAGEIIESLGGDEGLSDEDRECLTEAFDEELLRTIVVAGMVGGEDALTQDEDVLGKLLEVFAACPGALPTSD